MIRGLAIALAVLALAACGADGSEGDAHNGAAVPRAAVDRFDGDRALELAAMQVRFGQRPAGSAQLRALAVRLRARLPNGRFEPVPGSPGLRNIVGSLPGRGRPIVLAAHYDTLVEPKGFVGANNGAAGSAIVIEAASALARGGRRAGGPPIRFVLFDGEEPAAGLPEQSADFYSSGLRGSRAYAAKNRGKIGAMVLLDYVGNAGLRLPREATSDQRLWSRVRAAARRVGVGSVFPPDSQVVITDDHTPFLRQGVPAVDMIDWSYPGHSLSDGLDKLSARSLDAVGETVVELLR